MTLGGMQPVRSSHSCKQTDVPGCSDIKPLDTMRARASSNMLCMRKNEHCGGNWLGTLGHAANTACTVSGQLLQASMRMTPEAGTRTQVCPGIQYPDPQCTTAVCDVVVPGSTGTMRHTWTSSSSCVTADTRTYPFVRKAEKGMCQRNDGPRKSRLLAQNEPITRTHPNVSFHGEKPCKANIPMCLLLHHAPTL